MYDKSHENEAAELKHPFIAFVKCVVSAGVSTIFVNLSGLSPGVYQ